jgi:hypothetical protein
MIIVKKLHFFSNLKQNLCSNKSTTSRVPCVPCCRQPVMCVVCAVLSAASHVCVCRAVDSQSCVCVYVCVCVECAVLSTASRAPYCQHVKLCFNILVEVQVESEIMTK